MAALLLLLLLLVQQQYWAVAMPVAADRVVLARHPASGRWRLERAGRALPFTIGLNHAGRLWQPCPSYDAACLRADIVRRLYRGNQTAAAVDTVRRLRGWGFGGSSYDLPLSTPAGQAMAAQMPFLALTMPLDDDDGAGPSSWQPLSRLHFPDPWSPDVQERMHARITAKCEAVRPQRHNLIGYIWTDMPSYDIRAVRARGAKDWVSTLRCLPRPADAGRRAYSAWLRAHAFPRGAAPTSVCARYGLIPRLCPSWEALELCSLNNSAVPAAMADDYRFLPSIVEQIYRTANASISACDPGALVLADTFHGWGCADCRLAQLAKMLARSADQTVPRENSLRQALEPDSILAVAAKVRSGIGSPCLGNCMHGDSMQCTGCAVCGRALAAARGGRVQPADVRAGALHVWAADIRGRRRHGVPDPWIHAVHLVRIPQPARRGGDVRGRCGGRRALRLHHRLQQVPADRPSGRPG
jgi:hypothetical protein